MDMNAEERMKKVRKTCKSWPQPSPKTEGMQAYMKSELLVEMRQDWDRGFHLNKKLLF